MGKLSRPETTRIGSNKPGILDGDPKFQGSKISKVFGGERAVGSDQGSGKTVRDGYYDGDGEPGIGARGKGSATGHTKGQKVQGPVKTMSKK